MGRLRSGSASCVFHNYCFRPSILVLSLIMLSSTTLAGAAEHNIFPLFAVSKPAHNFTLTILNATHEQVLLDDATLSSRGKAETEHLIINSAPASPPPSGSAIMSRNATGSPEVPRSHLAFNTFDNLSREELNTRLKNILGLAADEVPAASAELPEELASGRMESNTLREGIDPNFNMLIARLISDGFDKKEIEFLFRQLGVGAYSPAYMATKITELYGVGGIGINRERAQVPVLENYETPMSDVTMGSCLNLIKKYEAEFKDIEAVYGVPARTIVGLLLVETGLGLDLGRDTALRALAGMAATTTPDLLGSAGNSAQIRRVNSNILKAKLKEKSDWAYNEVKALIRYGKRNNINIALMPGSIYGAIGICQFMPSNIEPFAVDGDKDGKIDLFSVVDAIYSVAGYLEANGWRASMSRAQQFEIIKTYNHDSIYAARVLGAANQLDLAAKGKVSLRNNALAGGPRPASAFDPSLRRGRRVPITARIKSLGSYEALIP